MTDLIAQFAPLLAIAVFVERLLEVAFDLIERIPAISARRDNTATAQQWVSTKRISTIIAGILAGIIVAAGLNIPFPGLSAETAGSTVLAGAVAGSLSPYAHQILEGLWNTQKLLEEIKKGKAGAA